MKAGKQEGRPRAAWTKPVLEQKPLDQTQAGVGGRHDGLTDQS